MTTPEVTDAALLTMAARMVGQHSSAGGFSIARAAEELDVDENDLEYDLSAVCDLEACDECGYWEWGADLDDDMVCESCR